MAKRSRRPVRPEPASPDAGATARSSSGAPGARSARPRRAVAQPGILERYRTLIFGGAAVVGVVIVAWLFLQGGVQAGYKCDSLLTPGPSESLTPLPPTPTPSPTPSATPTPSITAVPSGSVAPSASVSPAPSPTATATAVPSPTPRLGFTTSLLGRNHVLDLNATLRYAFCPPTSGDHFNDPQARRGPIHAAVYPANEEQVPGGWIHNMEHGYVVALYRCPSGVLGQGDCISQAEMDQMQAFFDQAPDSINPSCLTKVVVARFDTMDTRFALLAWGRALLTDEFDLDTALLFAQQWTDAPAVPERGLC